MLRFHDQGLPIREFTLRIRSSDPFTMSPRTDNWMLLAVRVASICCTLRSPHYTNYHPWLTYCLLPKILESKSVVRFIFFGGVLELIMES